ncbi:hypothetical protein CASFOL_005288 [Castilleja foliolosa]|uniref:Uncharacterized protein n=1 Tax=Castilleja foliolosa TaxID=1961234 RepID=A0ABD3E304_9LAMI
MKITNIIIVFSAIVLQICILISAANENVVFECPPERVSIQPLPRSPALPFGRKLGSRLRPPKGATPSPDN